MSERKVEVIVDNDECYRRINVAGIVGGVRPIGLEATIYSERQVPDDIVQIMNIEQKPPSGKVILRRKIECELILDPLQMVILHNWLGERIQEYQTRFGPHPLIKKAEASQNDSEGRTSKDTEIKSTGSSDNSPN